MAMFINLLLFFCVKYTYSYLHSKPIAANVWRQNCDRNSHVLNDCNWCKCDRTLQYTCKARVCNEVDMFGHFNDAISELQAGMEGHGAWRSSATPCEPGNQYKRGVLMCICGENGNWPNPVCRDAFRFLHPVQIRQASHPENNDCEPNTLVVYGCRICSCPISGKIDLEYCDDKYCEEDYTKLEENDEIEEIYAECDVNEAYKIGCKSCTCLKNNRLLCNHCDNAISQNVCHDRKSGEIFTEDCNLCYCEGGFKHCTTRICLNNTKEEMIEELLSTYTERLRTVNKFTDTKCVVGTEHKSDCNQCTCFEKNGVKIVACTKKNCNHDIIADCVEDKTYKVDCLLCHCAMVDGLKRELCHIENECVGQIQERPTNGYCEPLHIYKDDCNECICDRTGKILSCTTKNCPPKKPISVLITPVLENIGVCPKGHSYKVDCNVCYCIEDNKILCSSNICRRKVND